MCEYSKGWAHFLCLYKFNLKTAASDLEPFTIGGFAFVQSRKFPRSIRKIPFPVHLSYILRDTWNNVLEDARSWRVQSAHGMRLIVLKMKRVSVKNSTEGYTSETWRSMSKSSGVLPDSQHGATLVFADTIACRQLSPKYGAFLCCFFFTSDLIRVYYIFVSW